MTQETRLRVASNPTRGWQANKKTHLCVASGIRAMPEKEKPPAMRVDNYCMNRRSSLFWSQIRKQNGTYEADACKADEYEGDLYK